MKQVHFDMIGNDAVKEYLSSAVIENRLNHAYIIEGAEGSGRRMLVKQLISALACESENAPCGVCGSCVKIAAGVCVDVYDIKVPAGRSEITVDVIRDMISGIMISPNDLDFKAYIVYEADKMNLNAQNALLKVLEEPPTDVYFFLITCDSAKLLPTVRSRALTLRMQRLDEAQMAAALDKNGVPDNEKRRGAIKLAGGSAGAAIKLYNGDNDIVKQRKICAELIDVLSDRHRSEIEFTMLHHRYFKKAEDMIPVYEMLLAALRDAVLCRRGAFTELEYFTNEEEAEALLMSVSDPAASEMTNIICEYLYSADIPTNQAMTMTEYSSRLWKAHLI